MRLLKRRLFLVGWLYTCCVRGLCEIVVAVAGALVGLRGLYIHNG